jgi:hypothetical protein
VLQSAQYAVNTSLYNVTSSYLSVWQVSEDNWLYHASAESGALSFGPNSALLSEIAQVYFEADSIRWLLDTGNVSDYSWLIGAPATPAKPALWVGGSESNYTDLLSSRAQGESLTITSDAFGQFDVANFSLG